MLQRSIFIASAHKYVSMRNERKREMIKRILKSIERYNKYRSIFSELNRLNDKELADIGINRCDIPRIAAGERV